MMNHKMPTTDNTMNDAYYILTEGASQPLMSWGTIWKAFSLRTESSRKGRSDRR